MTPSTALRPPPLAKALAWLAALLLCWAVLAAVGFRSGDPDSDLYAGISADLAARPVAAWIAPDWGGRWETTGLFREHPVGLFLLPAVMGKLGYPPEQAAYAANTLYQVASILLIERLVAVFAAGTAARTASWLVLFMPIAFTFRIRANHEWALLLCFLAGLHGAERARTRLRWAWLVAAALVAAMLIKGLLAVLVLASCAVWVVVRSWGRTAELARGVTALGLAVAACAGVAVAYEALYARTAGESFLAYYLRRQGSLPTGAGELSPVRVGLNLGWYLGRLTWFAFPLSLITAVALWRTGRARVAAGVRRAPATTDDERAAAQGLVLTAALALLFVLAMSVGLRRADRYLFPAYFVVGACGAVIAVRQSAWFGRLAARLDRRPPAAQVGAFLLTFGLRILARGHLAWIEW